MDFEVHLVANLKMGQLHHSHVKNNSLRIAQFGNGLDHGVILRLTGSFGKPHPPKTPNYRVFINPTIAAAARQAAPGPLRDCMIRASFARISSRRAGLASKADAASAMFPAEARP